MHCVPNGQYYALRLWHATDPNLAIPGGCRFVDGLKMGQLTAGSSDPCCIPSRGANDELWFRVDYAEGEAVVRAATTEAGLAAANPCATVSNFEKLDGDTPFGGYLGFGGGDSPDE